ncbi:MAG: hypothetical protein HY268_08715 [Deltaproteobacteria bacterium]|nr:hypothetical protein [Deltaproteobacteria bacterium]
MRPAEWLNSNFQLLFLPRYEPFTKAVTELANKGVQFIEIAGNEQILMTVIAPPAWQATPQQGEILLARPILTQPDKKRVAITVTVSQLHAVIPSLAQENVTVDHIYDF